MKKITVTKNGVITNSAVFETQELVDIWLSENSFTECTIDNEDLGDIPKWSMIREKRDRLLSFCDWTQLADSPLDSGDKTAWATYRQTLRDLPENQSDIDNIIWPNQPS